MSKTIYSSDVPRLYRGVDQPIPEDGQHDFIREDRRPRDTGGAVAFNICFNLMIEYRFGVQLIRRRALFVSGDMGRALKYSGQQDPAYVGVIKPTEPFKFMYALNVPDSARLADDLTERYMTCFLGWQLERCTPLYQDIALTLQKLETFFTNNPDIDTGGFSWGRTSLRQRIYRTLDSFSTSPRHRQHTYQYTMEDLEAGARSGVEIMLFDCPGGYRIERL